MLQQENLQQKLIDRLHETAVTVIDHSGVSETNDALQLKLSEKIDGGYRRIIGASISQSDDSSTVWAFRTLDGNYLRVENSYTDDLGKTTEIVTALEVRLGEKTKFNYKEAEYSLRELTARLRGETTESRKEEELNFFDLEETSMPVIVRLPILDTQYANQMLDAEGNPLYNLQEFTKQVQDFENNPNRFQQFESLCRIVETFSAKEEVISLEELRKAKLLQFFSPEQLDKINDFLEASVFQTRIEGFKVPYSSSMPMYLQAGLNHSKAKELWQIQNKEERSPEDSLFLQRIENVILQSS